MTKPVELTVPNIGDFEEVEIIEVLVAPGDTVNVEDPLVSIESDKATMEVPASHAGTIGEVRVTVGDKVSEGSVIALLEATAAETPAAEPSAAARKAPATEPRQSPPEQAPSRPRPAGPSPPPTPPPPAQKSGLALPHASPGVRRFARELGVDLSQIRGSGPKTRILKEDVQTFVKSALSDAVAPAPESTGSAGIAPIAVVDFSKWGEIEVRALPRIKQLSGAHLHRAWLNVPHVTHHAEADVTELERFRRLLKDKTESKNVRVTPLTFIMKALAAVLKTFPHFNASLSIDGHNLILKKYLHIGIAVNTPNGLVVPVLRNVDTKGVYELASEMADVSQRARDGKLKAGEMQGGSMSISNLGGIGGSAFTPIVNVPEVAILGVSRTQMKPLWNGTEFVPRQMLPLDLSYDHRVIDGAEAARFIVCLCEILGDLRHLLL